MKPLTHITCFVLEQIESQPLARRTALYRDLAHLAATAKQSAEYNQLADDLESIARRHDQLVLNFKRKAEG